MPLTERDLQRRQSHAGASETAAIIGLDPFRNPADVYWSKVTTRERRDGSGDGEREAMAIGHMLEPGLVDWCERETGEKFRRNQFRVSTQDALFSATFDGLAAKSCGCEAKTTGIAWPTKEQWGEPGSDEVPDRVLVQCQHQMYVGDLDIVWVPALIGGRGRKLYCVARDNDLIAYLVAEVKSFWVNRIQARKPPEDITPSMETLKRIRREPESRVPLEEAVFAKYEESSEALKVLKKQNDQDKAELITALSEAECGVLPNGDLVTYLEQRRVTIDGKKLKEDDPAIYHNYAREKVYRVLRHKKG